MLELVVLIVLGLAVAVLGVRLGMLISPRIAKLDDRLSRTEEAPERDGDRGTTGR